MEEQKKTGLQKKLACFTIDRYASIYFTGLPKKPKLFSPFYFSFTTMSSVGYGDYSPQTRIAKMLVMSQQFLLIGEVVSLFGLDRIGNLNKST